MRKNTIVFLVVSIILISIFSGILYLFKLPSTIKCSFGDKTFSECSGKAWNKSVAETLDSAVDLGIGKGKGAVKSKSKKQSEI